jgi:hypothetical protein
MSANSLLSGSTFLKNEFRPNTSQSFRIKPLFEPFVKEPIKEEG